MMTGESERTAILRQRLQETLKDAPELRAAIKQSIEKMKKPENIKPMAETGARLLMALRAIQRR